MSIFPFIDSTSTSTETNDELPMLKEYAYDFEKNELLLDEGGRTYMVEGNEALRIWIFKERRVEHCTGKCHSCIIGIEYCGYDSFSYFTDSSIEINGRRRRTFKAVTDLWKGNAHRRRASDLILWTDTSSQE